MSVFTIENELKIKTVGDLKRYIANLPDGMRVFSDIDSPVSAYVQQRLNNADTTKVDKRYKPVLIIED